ncbi:LADA_0H11540g1_1 [Lachancea dasiensis]|uniref:LADA_0H11540g1_1 n=1 Tax=Lachancea dasiensis TaxID=1072105 RepID=A0A1G4K3U6_9SACH|nr:LADA_0H11540g1_1 [Lachancea dasiensis]
MGIKRFFKIKPPEEDTPEMNREKLNELGIPTKNVSRVRKEKFSAYGHFAKDHAEDRYYAPPGYDKKGQTDSATLNDLNKSAMDSEPESDAYMRAPDKSGFDPYARNNVQDNMRATNPYEKQAADPYSRGSPYGMRSTDPYSQQPAKNNSYGGQQPGTSNPYNRAPQAESLSSNPYSGQQKSSSTANPYVGRQNSTSQNSSRNATPGTSQNPYGSLANDPYAGSQNNVSYGSAAPQHRPSASLKNSESYNSGPQRLAGALRDPYAASASSQGPASLDRTSSVPPDDSFNFESEQQAERSDLNDDEIDLNATLQQDEDDFNGSMHAGYEGSGYQRQQQQYAPTGEPSRGFQTFEDLQRENELKQQQEEDEAVDEIKKEIRFTKQSSVASTRNTLKMAQEAEMAGTNTLGMLGHQSEKLNNVERNLDLMKMQNRVADDKVAELKKLNRNILAVHVSNPFNSKRRLREAEDRIRNQRIEDKLMQKQTNGRLQQSTNRIEGALNASSHEPHDSVKQRYQNQAILEKAKRYQFENDEEDDEMELEIDKNLDKVGQVSGRLKRLAIATGGEIDAQQGRVKNIEEDTDNLDIKIHMNTTRLTQIR